MITTLNHKTIVDSEGINCRLIRELQPFVGADVDPSKQLRLGLVVDTETTGVDSSKCKLLEFAAIPFMFDADGVIAKALPAVQMLNDPGEKIDPEVSVVTGIKNSDVDGHYADPAVIDKVLGRATIVIAHNAKFDWRVLKNHGVMAKPPWLCTHIDMDWGKFGLSNGKLDYLAYKFGFYYNAHRAKADCEALLQLLSSELPDGATVLRHVFSGMAKAYRISANNSPFSSKDILRQRGYRWDGDRKVWWVDVKGDKPFADEMDWLTEHVYDGECKATHEIKDATNRFA